MDLILALKKYSENYKLIFAISILFIFLLLMINPIFSLSGGSLNLTYNISNIGLANLVITLIALIAFITVFTVIQVLIISRVENSYNFNRTSNTFEEIKHPFFELLKFNIIFYIAVFAIYSFIYDLGINALIFDIVLFVVMIIVWSVPQIVIMERESVEKSIIISLNYINQNWIFILYLFLVSFILMIITIVIDVLFGNIAGSIISTGFFVLFVIPYIEILKTEMYLDKYRLLKPFNF
ncbi:MAG: hypothetical protein V1824_01565 [archaeon]